MTNSEGNINILVLVVEADNVSFRLLELLLNNAEIVNMRFKLESSHSLASAHERLAQEPAVDLILLDLYLPDSSGLDTFVSIQKVSKGIPIIVLTSSDDLKLAVEVVNLGAWNFITRGSMGSSTLVRAIRLVMEKSRSIAQEVRDESH